MEQYLIVYGARTLDGVRYYRAEHCSTLLEVVEWAQEHPDAWVESVAKLW